MSDSVEKLRLAIASALDLLRSGGYDDGTDPLMAEIMDSLALALVETQGSLNDAAQILRCLGYSVYGNARVSGSAHVYARLGDLARVSGMSL